MSTAGFFLWGVSSVGRAPALQAGGRGFKSHTFQIWVGSESANAADCKSAPFGGSGLDTHPAHLAAVVQMEEASGLSPAQCEFESYRGYAGLAQQEDAAVSNTAFSGFDPRTPYGGKVQ